MVTTRLALAVLTELPFAAASFDYVVSLDVFGHIGFDEKDAVLTGNQTCVASGWRDDARD